MSAKVHHPVANRASVTRPQELMRQRMAEKLGVSSAAHVGAAIKAQYAVAAGGHIQHKQTAPATAAAVSAAALSSAAAAASAPAASVALSLLGDYDDRYRCRVPAVALLPFVVVVFNPALSPAFPPLAATAAATRTTGPRGYAAPPCPRLRYRFPVSVTAAPAVVVARLLFHCVSVALLQRM